MSEPTPPPPPPPETATTVVPPPPETAMTAVPPPPQVPAPPLPQVPPPIPPARTLPVLVPHLIWEAVLLLAAAAVVVLAAVNTGGLFAQPTWWSLAYLGLLASGLAFSLRMGAPNLAVTGVAALSGSVYANVVTGKLDYPPFLAVTVALGAALGAGLVLGLVAGLTSVPGWAVSLGGLALLVAAVNAMNEDAGGFVRIEPFPEPLDRPAIWVALFLLVTLAGGAIAAIPPVARWFAARRGEEPRFSGGRLLSAVLGFAGSSLLAGLAGLATAGQQLVVFGSADIFSLLLALAVVLLAGVSVYGGRGGIIGVALAVVLVVAVRHWLLIEDAGLAVLWAVAGAAVLIGILVSRLLEALAPFPRAEPYYVGPVT